MLAKLIESVNMSVSRHGNFRKEVANVIRNKEMKPEEKINEISNILM